MDVTHPISIRTRIVHANGDRAQSRSSPGGPAAVVMSRGRIGRTGRNEFRGHLVVVRRHPCLCARTKTGLCGTTQRTLCMCTADIMHGPDGALAMGAAGTTVQGACIELHSGFGAWPHVISGGLMQVFDAGT